MNRQWYCKGCASPLPQAPYDRIEALEAALRAILAVPASPTVDADIDDIARAALAPEPEK